MAPCCVFGWIPRFTGTESGCPYGGSSQDGELFSPLERIERFSMHFNGLFYFALQHFRSTAILLERINVVKQGTTVLRMGAPPPIPKYPSAIPSCLKADGNHISPAPLPVPSDMNI